MKKYLPIFLSMLIVGAAAYIAYQTKHQREAETSTDIGSFERQPSCSRQPNFLARMRIPQPIAIDLSQDHYKGLAFLYGVNLSQAIHTKAWERFDYFSTYALDPQGTMYLSPMPFISINSKTFDLQKNIYRLDSTSGNLDIWMTIDEVNAGSNNPFGIIALEYDCTDQTLWVSAIDESDYTTARGVIYHIDIATKTVLQRVEGVDALSLKLLQTQKGKYLLAGSARDNRLYAYAIQDQKLAAQGEKLLELQDANEHIRKIILRGNNHLELQTIPFTYTLIAQTTDQGVRTNYNAIWDTVSASWNLNQVTQ